MLADSLGFAGAYRGEHRTDPAEIVTSSVAIFVSIASETSEIQLGTGNVNLPNSHPTCVAADVVTLDLVFKGRLSFAVSPGSLTSNTESFGNIKRDQNAMFLGCINMVLDSWAGEAPCDLEGELWHLLTERFNILDLD